MSLKCLPQSTIKLIGSSQVITSVSAAVKELIENSLDAGALSIDVKLDNHGMDRIEVRDDGLGISKEDVALMCKKSYTSKITSFSDLDGLSSYGFRGEALNALCAVSKLSVTTKTEEDTLAYTYIFDNDGTVKDSKPSHVNKGTVIVAEGLFRNLPVRRQFLTNGRRRSEEIKKVESIVKSLAIVHPRLRVTFTHNKFLIWQKNSVANLKQSLAQAIPPTIISQLHAFHFTDETTQLDMDVLLPKKDCNISVICFSNKDDAFYLYINSRPVRHKELEKVIESEMAQYFGHYIPNNKYPLCLLSIKLSPDTLDVNLEPNKTKVVIKDLDYLKERISNQFLKFYTGTPEKVEVTTPIDINSSKRKLNVELINGNSKIPKIESSPEEVNHCVVETIFQEDDLTPPANNQFFTNEYSQDDKQNVGDDSALITDPKEISEQLSSGEFEKIDIPKSDSVHKEDTFSAQDLDDLELILARSTQSSIVVEPDINSSLDLFGSSQNSEFVNSDSSDVNVPTINKSSQQSRCENVSEFLSGLPIKDLDSESHIEHHNVKDVKNNLSEHVESNKKQYDTVPKNFMEENMALESITMSQWSKGHVLKPSSEPVSIKSTLLECHQINLESNEIMPQCGPYSVTDEKSKSLQEERSVSSQMGCKNMSAFTKFAKEMRAKIIEQSPGISFTRVASELASRWRDLAENEKSKYENLVSQEKASASENKLTSPEPKLKQTSVKPKPSVQPNKSSKKMRFDKVVEMETSLTEIRSRMEARYSVGTVQQHKVLCKLTDDLYCFSTDTALSVLSALRLNEVITYYKNMSTMAVPLKILEKNIAVTIEDIGMRNWHTLECLQTSVDLRNNTIVVDNEIITKNGFRIEVSEGNNGKLFEITDVAAHISFYGVEDLNELLTLLDKQGSSASLLDSRPLKVVSFIRSETIRTCSKTQLNFENKGWDSMFNFWMKNVRDTFPECPHHKPVSTVLYTFSHT